MGWKHQIISDQHQKWAIPRFKSTPMLMALMIWLCALPVLALVAAPLLGWKIAASLAGFLLVADTVVCWSLCRVRILRGTAACDKCLKRLNAQSRHPKYPKAQRPYWVGAQISQVCNILTANYITILCFRCQNDK